ncbi:MAG: carbon storage regulator [Phycisphaerae bacterium]|nr:carbon storage regulator [Phycisphaerae bacterium]
MLVLSRKNDQAVIIASEVDLQNILKVTVLAIRGGSVRLGFEANEDVHVHREEVWERVRAARPRDPPAGDTGRTKPSSTVEVKRVLSGLGKGRSPKSLEGRALRA